MVFCSGIQIDASPSATVLLAWPPAPGVELPPGKLCSSWYPEPWRTVLVVQVFVFRKGVG